jgi:7,8-dihydroneopterin aldolase/epimerase/oxygenase
MRFHVRVGVLPHEREIPQPLEIDLTVHLAPPATDVVDYRTLYALVRDIMEREPLGYLETVAGDVASSCLAHGSVASVRVAVRKPHVALGGPLAYAEIVVERDRG